MPGNQPQRWRIFGRHRHFFIMPNCHIQGCHRLADQWRDLGKAIDKYFLGYAFPDHAFTKIDDPNVRLNRVYTATNLQPMENGNAQALNPVLPITNDKPNPMPNSAPSNN